MFISSFGPFIWNTFPLWNDYARLANVWGCYTMGRELPFLRLNGWLECPHAGHGIRNSSSLTSLPVLFWEQRKAHTVGTLQLYLPTVINGIKLKFKLISPSMSTRGNPRGLNSKRPILCWVQGELGEKGAPCNPWIHRAQKMVKSEAEFYSGDSPTLMVIETSFSTPQLIPWIETKCDMSSILILLSLSSSIIGTVMCWVLS